MHRTNLVAVLIDELISKSYFFNNYNSKQILFFVSSFYDASHNELTTWPVTRQFDNNYYCSEKGCQHYYYIIRICVCILFPSTYNLIWLDFVENQWVPTYGENTFTILEIVHNIIFINSNFNNIFRFGDHVVHIGSTWFGHAHQRFLLLVVRLYYTRLFVFSCDSIQFVFSRCVYDLWSITRFYY